MIEGLQTALFNDLDDKASVFNTNVLTKTLHVLIRNYPLLIPQLVKLTSGKFFKKSAYMSQAPHSFLSFLMRGVVFASGDKLNSILYELCLDTSVGSAAPLRCKIITDLYELLKAELDSPELFQTPASLHSLTVYSTLHTYLLSLREIVKLSIKEEPNFLQLYQSLLIKMDIKKYYQQEALYPFILEPLSLLF